MALLLLLSATLPHVAAGQVYRSIDENGTVTYSNTKPPGRDATQIEVPSPSANPSNPSRSNSPQDLIAAADKARTDRLDRAKVQSEEKAAASERAQLCTRARANLEGMENNSRAFHIDSAGERVRLGEEQRQEDITKLRALVAKHCVD